MIKNWIKTTCLILYSFVSNTTCLPAILTYLHEFVYFFPFCRHDLVKHSIYVFLFITYRINSYLGLPLLNSYHKKSVECKSILLDPKSPRKYHSIKFSWQIFHFVGFICEINYYMINHTNKWRKSFLSMYAHASIYVFLLAW